jgi:hypothetical protein
MTMFRALVSFAFVLVTSCKAGSNVDRIIPSGGILSPAGWCKAAVTETTSVDGQSGSTQVALSFDGGKCGRNAVSSNQVGLGLQLRWLDDSTLEVGHPVGATMVRSPSGEVLQCLDHRVRVVLRPL